MVKLGKIGIRVGTQMTEFPECNDRNNLMMSFNMIW